MRSIAVWERWCAAAIGAGVVGLILAGCSAGGAANPSSSAGGNAPGKSSDTITWAEPPGTTPDWIWPFMPRQEESNANIQFQQMMYRPLYWFGDDGSTSVNESLSLADVPVFSNGGKTVTITLKDYTWSDGETLTPQDVLFWINMAKAEKTNDDSYNPGQFPDNIVSATEKNSDTVVLTTDRAYSQQWFLYNQLSQIVPMPMAWDVTGPGRKGTCAVDAAGCAAVYSYMSRQSKNMPGYASDALWSVVDGPWKLSSFNSDGHISFVPNPKYSGPVKATIKKFTMVPFTTDTAEFNVLRGGSTLDVGYIPTQDIAKAKPAGSAPNQAGPNPLSSDYRLEPWFLYGINYFPLNMNNPTVGPIFRQLYFRQAFQSLVDQRAVITSAAKNYGIQTTGPIPLFPSSPLISTTEKTNPYPFSMSAAKKYLSDNGWKVTPGGTSTCVKPGTGAGDCGAGVAAGTPLTFTLPYASGTSTIDTAMASLKSNAAQVGIVLNLKPEPFNTVIGATVPCKLGPSCSWQMGNWGGGWSYGPDYYPTGELLFATGAAVNSGSYSDARMDRLIEATNVDNSTAAMTAYEDYAARQLPVVYQPDYTFQLTEVADGVKGLGQQNPYGWITPEAWHF